MSRVQRSIEGQIFSDNSAMKTVNASRGLVRSLFMWPELPPTVRQQNNQNQTAYA